MDEPRIKGGCHCQFESSQKGRLPSIKRFTKISTNERWQRGQAVAWITHWSAGEARLCWDSQVMGVSLLTLVSRAVSVLKTKRHREPVGQLAY